MTTHPNTQTQHHDKPTAPHASHDIAPPTAHTDARDDPLLDVDVDVDREEIVPLGQHSPRPRPQTPPRKPCQPRALIAATIAAFAGLTITIVALLALVDSSKPGHHSRVPPTTAVNSPGAVAQHQAAATPRPVRRQRELAAQRHAQQHQRARRMAARQHARHHRVARRNRRALAQRRRLATRNARAPAAAWRRARPISRRSTPTRTRSHTTPPPPLPARPACGEFDLC